LEVVVLSLTPLVLEVQMEVTQFSALLPQLVAEVVRVAMEDRTVVLVVERLIPTIPLETVLPIKAMVGAHTFLVVLVPMVVVLGVLAMLPRMVWVCQAA